jgi:RNA polymerase sigma-70 factor (ECF subfamily)
MNNNIIVPDAELVYLIKMNQPAGAEALFDQYAKILALAIYHIVKNKQRTDTILEKAFVRIWQKIDQYNEQEKSLLSWFLSIARELANEIQEIDYLKFKQENSEFNVGNIRLA